MEARYHNINGKVFKLHRTAEQCFFFEVRSLPLPNVTQYHGRRLERWHNKLLAHGWEESDLPRLTLTSELSRVRDARRKGLAEASAEQTAAEQCLHLEAVVFLLLVQSARQQAEPLPSSEDAIQFFDDFSRKIKGEIGLGRDLVAACSATNGLLNVQVLHALRRNKQGESVHHWLSKKLKTVCCDEGNVTLLQVGCACLEARLDLHLMKQFCEGVAAMWHQHLSDLWPTLQTNPLAAGSLPERGPKKNRRMDPTAMKVLLETASSGGTPALISLANNFPGAAAWTTNIKARTADAPRRAKQTFVQQEVHKIRSHGANQPVPRLSIACDASRVGGEKTMVLFFTWLQEQISCWACPQTIRDFAETAESNPVLAAAASRDRWVYGMKNFFEDISDSLWWETTARMVGTDDPAQNDQGKPKFGKVPKLQRLSSHDVMLALDNCLRSAGLSLAMFSKQSCV